MRRWIAALAAEQIGNNQTLFQDIRCANRQKTTLSIAFPILRVVIHSWYLASSI